MQIKGGDEVHLSICCNLVEVGMGICLSDHSTLLPFDFHWVFLEGQMDIGIFSIHLSFDADFDHVE